jgi:hypothetical protein
VRFDRGSLQGRLFRVTAAAFSTVVAVLVMAAAAGGEEVVQYQWTMDSDPGWACEADWEFGVPLGLGGEYGNPDPESGHTGTNVYGYNLEGDYQNNMSETEYLTTEAIDCTGVSYVSLRFWRWLGVEGSDYDHATIDVSGDGGTTWTNVWVNPPDSPINAGQWEYQIYSLSAVADGQPDVRVRWGMGPTDGSWRFCGWNIDDVEIWGLAPSPVERASWSRIKGMFR